MVFLRHDLEAVFIPWALLFYRQRYSWLGPVFKKNLGLFQRFTKKIWASLISSVRIFSAKTRGIYCFVPFYSLQEKLK